MLQNTEKILVTVFCLILSFSVCILPVSAAAPGTNKNKVFTDVPASWLAKVKQDIAAREYYISQTTCHDPAIGNTLQAPNRHQNLRTWFTSSGIMVQHRVKEDNPWTFRLAPKTAGVAGAMRKLDFGKPQAAGNRITYPGKYINQWFENRPEGLEQGFTIPKPLGQGELLITLNVAGNLKPALKNPITIKLNTPEGVTILEYGNLKVTDANQKSLSSSLSLTAAQITIHIDTAGAVYPLVVDPLLCSTSLQVVGENADDRFGYSVACGDVNGDGFNDMIVGAEGYDNGEDYDAGAAYVYLGTAAGVQNEPIWQAVGENADDHFGNSIACGDVNGNGREDVIVGAQYYNNGEDYYAGAAYVYLSTATGVQNEPVWKAVGENADYYFGSSIACGDVNGDDRDDLIVGAFMYDNGEDLAAGAAYVYLGTAAGVQNEPVWKVVGENQSDWFGSSVTCGDVNGDGRDDVIVGAPSYYNGEDYYAGTAYVYLGTVSGVQNNPVWQAVGKNADDHFGASVAGGDVNGDGRDDVIVGTFMYDNGEDSDAGAVYVYLGTAAGVQNEPVWQAVGENADDWFGSSVACGDFNGDGFNDVIVGADGYDNGEDYNAGAAYVYLGTTAGVQSEPVWQAAGKNQNDHFGYSIAAGDVNGDGRNDLIVVTINNAGAACVYLSTDNMWQKAGTQRDATFGYSVSGAGDVNNDGFDDVIIGAPWFDHGKENEGAAFVYQGSINGLNCAPYWSVEGDQAGARFGSAVSSAGNADGDEFDDVIVGAPYYDGNTGVDSGRAVLYFGSENGLGATVKRLWEGEHAGDLFGYSVSSAGDIMGNGKDLVIVGAPFYTNVEVEEGAVYVLKDYGQISWQMESNQAGAHLGWSVSTAGDVNDDDIPDIIAGAPDYTYSPTDHGAAFAWLGSADGSSFSLAPMLLGDAQANSKFGYSVSDAGDVNGDGVDEVIIGAPYYDAAVTGETDHGAAFVYTNFGTWPLALAAWWWTGNNPNDHLGYSVSGAGDVNNDGFDDVIVGGIHYNPVHVSDGGAAYLYLGSDTGCPATPSWQVASNQFNSWFGASVASAGDVNGDDYDDLIVGAYMYGSANEGAAFVYYGTEANIAISPSTMNFGMVEVGNVSDHRYLEISNQGFTNLILGSIALSGSGTGQFSIESDPCSGSNLAPGENCSVAIVFNPSLEAETSAVITIPSNDPDTPVLEIPLSGTGTNLYYRDYDGDSYGDPAVSLQACAPEGYVSDNSDCNDHDDTEHPGQTWYKDADGDHYSDGVTNSSSCTRPLDYYVTGELQMISGDNDDYNSTVYPGAPEICDDKDNDQDGSIDEGGVCEVITCPVPDTGQTKCYDNAVEIACPALGGDFYGQDAQYVHARSYTKLDSNGTELPNNAENWYMVRDDVTGLVWEVKQANDGTKDYANPNDADNDYTWYDSNPDTNGGNSGTAGNGTDTTDFINALNTANYGGHSDWRLPTATELSYLRNLDRVGPSIDVTYFPQTQASTLTYWSSLTSCNNNSSAYYVDFYKGSVFNANKSSYCKVRAVCSGQDQPLYHLTINENNPTDPNDDTVTDSCTNLMWQRNSSTVAMTWEAALAWCRQLNADNFAGYNDWRLPNINELQSLVDYSRCSPAIYNSANGTESFSGNLASSYWSSSTGVSDSGKAWRIYFGYGLVNYDNDKTENFYVRAVRSEQSEVYVELSGYCNGETPCFSTISAARLVADKMLNIKVAAGDYIGSLVLSLDKEINLTGGWNEDYSLLSSCSVIKGSLTISNGTLTITAGCLVLDNQ